MNKKYTIKISYLDGEEETITLVTDNIKWSLDQYQRNRNPFDSEITSEVDA
jgi:hypothetical protein